MIYLILTTSSIVIIALLLIVAIVCLSILFTEKPVPTVKNDLTDILTKLDEEQKHLHQ